MTHIYEMRESEAEALVAGFEIRFGSDHADSIPERSPEQDWAGMLYWGLDEDPTETLSPVRS